jgi:hypothetical protein
MKCVLIRQLAVTKLVVYVLKQSNSLSISQGGKTMAGKDGNLWSRIAVILFALAIVAIGLQPIQREHGGLLRFLNKKTTAFANSLKQGAEEIQDLPKRDSGEAAPVVVSPSKRSASPDKITDKDRNELDSLLNGL